MSVRYLSLLALAVMATAGPVSAHHVNVADSERLAPSPLAQSVSLQGRVDEISVFNRVTGSTKRYSVLAVDDGRRVKLNGVNATDRPAGATISVDGKLDGRSLFAQAVRTIGAPDPRRVAAQAPSSYAGTLRLGHADNFDGTPSEFFYAVVTDAGPQLRIDLGTLLDALENGMHVRVSGVVTSNGELAADQIEILSVPDGRLIAAVTPDAGPVTTSYIVIPIKFPTNAAPPYTYAADPFTVASLATAVFGTGQSVAKFYEEGSYGQQLLSGVVADDGAGGWLLSAAATPTTCDIDAIASAADTAATARGYSLGSYVGRVYVFTSNVPGCGWSGLAYVGWARSWIKQTSNLLVIGHEIGHNFGLLHAASLDCSATTVVGGTCTSAEYGDPFDTMGNNRAMHFASSQKSILGWLPAGTVATHNNGRATYTLSPIETIGGVKYAVKVPAATARTYWIEYRQPIGFDAGLSSFPNNGAQIRVVSPFESICSGCADDTEFLDFTPATAAFTDGTLTAGQAYWDFNIGVKVISATPSALTVEVSAPVRRDIDLDGKSDLLWRNTTTGQNVSWLMNGVTPTAVALSPVAPAGWVIGGMGDVDRDGRSDVIWYYAPTGTVYAWLMDGTGVKPGGVVMIGSVGPGWTIEGVGDLNGDGVADVLWRHTSGAVYVWYLDTGGAIASVVSLGAIDSSWRVAGIAKLSNDGVQDIVWMHDASGGVYAWMMKPTGGIASVVALGAVPGWSVARVADFDGDGVADLFWRSTSVGANAIWYMNANATVRQVQALSGVPIADWTIGAVGDFDGDGLSDVLWYTTSTGVIYQWFMKGPVTAPTVSAVGVIGANWSLPGQ